MEDALEAQGEGCLSANKKSASPRAKAAAARETARKVGLRLHGSAREGVIIVLLAACIFLLLALLSFTMDDPGWSYSGPETDVANWMGPAGAWLADVLYSLFGVSALWWPGMVGFAAWWLMRSRQERFDWDTTSFAVRCGGMLLVLLGSTTLGALYFNSDSGPLPYSSGGILGKGLVLALKPLVGTGGTGLLSVAGVLCGIPLMTGLSWLNVMDEAGHRCLQFIHWVRRRFSSNVTESDGKTAQHKPGAKAPELATDKSAKGSAADESASVDDLEPAPRWWQRLVPGFRRDRAEAAEVAAPRRSEPGVGLEGRADIPWHVPEETPSAKQPGAAYAERMTRPSQHSSQPEARPSSPASSQTSRESREPTLGSAFTPAAATGRASAVSGTEAGTPTMSLRAERDEPESLMSRHAPAPEADQTAAPAPKSPEPPQAQAPRSETTQRIEPQPVRRPAPDESPAPKTTVDVPPAPPVATPEAQQGTAPLQPEERKAPEASVPAPPGTPPSQTSQAPSTSDASAPSAAEGDGSSESTSDSSSSIGSPEPRPSPFAAEQPREERRAEEIPEPVLPDDGGALAGGAVAGASLLAATHEAPRPAARPDAGHSTETPQQSPQSPPVQPLGVQQPQQPPSQAPAGEGPIATAEQGRAAADSGGPTLWTVEHLQSQRPGLEDMPEPDGELPSLRLLTPPEPHQPNYTEQQLADMAELLEMRLREYGVKAEVVDTWPGPVITRFEIKPAAGVKVSKISNLAKDLARSLMVKSVRVVEVIPGRPTVGIEIPNPNRAMIRLREVIDSDRYQQEASALTMALGQDIGGAPVTANLGKMPHVLVAGTTGSGKSVGVNAMLISMLLKATPAELRLIMVDPKMLELSVYDGIPHLLAPVVTDMKEAANGLRWCVAEMERRYKLMAAMGVRNIAGFNSKLDEAERAGAQVADPLWEPQPWEMHQTPPVLEKLPYIVVVIDEFADMFMIVGKKVEELIARLAQKARAAGIHLILATQRPSVDVVTGLIKANIPTRMAFQVSSRVDSRTILDQGGAENLLGHGDMLYLPAGSGQPTRVHGAFVDDDEVHRVVEDWKRRGEPEYIDEILSGGVSADALTGLEAEGGDDGDSEQDALYDEAVAFVTETRRASISAVQRRFKIGYNRAARLVESMEAAGVVSPMGSNGGREVLAPPPVGG